MIFISSPYSHPDKKIVLARYEATCKYAAHLFANHEFAISPVIVGHNVLNYEKLPSDFQFWKLYSFTLLRGCSQLHVLELPGWEESIGIANELIYASEHDKWIKHISVTENGYVET